jgi:spoIIIJ-associated protein
MILKLQGFLRKANLMVQEQRTIEQQAPTVEEAVAAGLAKLGLAKDQVEIEIVDEGRRGVLGIGGREAVVRLHVRIEPLAEELETQKPIVEQPETVAKSAPKEVPEMKTAAAVEKTPVVKPAPEVDGSEESAVAVDVVASLLEKMGVEASTEVSISPPDDLTGQRITLINITGEDLGILIGARGETLDAMQHLARLMVGHRIRKRANFVIDIEGYRERRQQALARLAERMGQKAVDRGAPVTLEPMPAYERRIIHMTLREDPRVRTESTGEGDRRRVRIYPL